MPESDRRPRRRSDAALVALFAAGGAAWSASAWHAARDAGPPPTAVTAPAPAAPTELHVTAPPPPALPPAPPSERRDADRRAATATLEEPVGLAEWRAVSERALAHLRRRLGTEPCSRAEWERAVVGWAASLPPEAAAPLAERAADSRRGLEERVAAAALCAELAADSLSVPPGALSALREAFARADVAPADDDAARRSASLLASAAARSLTALGSRGDRAALARALVEGSDATATAASFGLRAGDDETALELAELLAAHPLPAVVERAAPALDGLATARAPSPALRAELTERLAAALARTEDDAAASRLFLCLARVGGSDARALLERTARSDAARAAAATRALASSPGPESAAALASLVRGADEASPLALAAAEGLARAEAASVADRGDGAALLARVAHGDPDWRRRRRAAFALGNVPPRGVAGTLEALARDDPHALVRAAAETALARSSR